MLVDGWKIRPCGMVSSSLYIINNVRVTAKMGDMVDFSRTETLYHIVEVLLHYYLIEEEPGRIAYAVMP